MRVFKWAAINGAYLWCIYAGFVKGIDGAQNVALAWGWFSAVVGLLCLIGHKKMTATSTPRIVKALDPLVDTAAAFAFLWFGHTALGICVFLSIAGFNAVRK